MSQSESTTSYQQAADILRGARYPIALTGAGVSTHSGVPDFRSPHSGLWENVDPFEVASLMGFRQDPSKFFNWIRPLTKLARSARPNPAHFALAEMESMGFLKGLITQNIDDLHARAGSNTLWEVHGSMRDATCVECFTPYDTESFLPDFLDTGDIPRCPACRGILKPNVILFGEQLPINILNAAQQASRECDVMLVAGSSLSVAPVSGFPMMALAHGAQIIIINYEDTYIDKQSVVVIHEDVAEVLPRIAALLKD